MFRYGLSSFVIALMMSAGGSAQQAPPAGTPPPPAKQADAQQAPASPRSPAQLVNIRLDLTISEQRAAGAPQSRLVTLLLADRENGRIRSGQGNAVLNVDARPEIVREGKIRAFVALEYRPVGEGDKATPLLNQSLAVLLDDGKPIVVSQSADPSAERSGVRVEVKATVVK